jgi:hypothetical protein
LTGKRGMASVMETAVFLLFIVMVTGLMISMMAKRVKRSMEQ